MTRRPEAVLGLHFFNPAPLMALVELVTTSRTNDSTADRAEAFARSLGKVPVRCADAPGFIVNRVGRPYVIEAVRMLEAGEGSVEGIDAALEGAGYPMGPFRLLDLIGLDVDLAIDEPAARGLRRCRPLRAARAPNSPRRRGAPRPQARRGLLRVHARWSSARRSGPLPRRQRERTAPLDRPRSSSARARGHQRGLPRRRGRRGPATGHRRGDAPRRRATRPGPSSGGRHRPARGRRETAPPAGVTAPRSGDQYRIAPLLWHMATV